MINANVGFKLATPCFQSVADRDNQAVFFWWGQGDRVKSYCWGGYLWCWKSNDKVYVERAKWLPHCKDIIQKERFPLHDTTSSFPNLYRALLHTLVQAVPPALFAEVFCFYNRYFLRPDRLLLSWAYRRLVMMYYAKFSHNFSTSCKIFWFNI